MLLFIFVFDCLVYALRLAVGAAVGTAVARDLGAQLLNMAVLYTLMGLLNRRSRTSRSPQAAKQVGGRPTQAPPPWSQPWYYYCGAGGGVAAPRRHTVRSAPARPAPPLRCRRSACWR